MLLVNKAIFISTESDMGPWLYFLFPLIVSDMKLHEMKVFHLFESVQFCEIA